MIVSDLCQPHYQVLLITYPKFTEKNAKDARGKKIKSACNFIGLKKNKLNYECKEFKKRWLMSINELIRTFPNIQQFCNGDINKFILLLRRDVYPYEYIDSWKRFDQTPLPDKKKQRIVSRRHY